MTKRKPQRPKWATEYLQRYQWTHREFTNLLLGWRSDRPRRHLPDPIKEPEGHQKDQERVVRDELAREKTDSKVREAIRAGALPILPSLLQERLLDKIRPHVDDDTLDEIQRALAADKHYGPAYFVAPREAIRWATETAWFPRFPFTRKDITLAYKGRPSSRKAGSADDATSAKPVAGRFNLAEQALDSSAGRRCAIDAFLNACNHEGPPRKLLRSDIWKAAGYKDARSFEYWQGMKDRATRSSDENIRRILAMPATKFLALLRKKGLIDD